ncbi:uncharacterized protein PV09_01335 [Verruconis gallopava]|uniref:Uncharacterized protein n=1 Tax=Verruconis gallopava TaxID=253628 RepID=A0A0D1Z650_9PEZI|nr:uncharacterized protein PV09_01335 [Verruconis gallopava]KIW08432.1 hypothetical protein PV09_01335 [Verruconis gallopava]
MIDATGALVYKPEYEHESIHYKESAISGAYAGCKLNVPDEDPVDEYIRGKIKAMLDLVEQSVQSRVRSVNDALTIGLAQAVKVFYAATAPVTDGYRNVVAAPSRLHARLNKEKQAIKAELELIRLRLAEARL